MPTDHAVHRTRPVALVGGLCGIAVLTACSGPAFQDAADSSSASSSASAAPTSASSSASAPDSDAGGLAAGLLPGDAFGEKATVVTLSREQLQQSAGLAADPDSLDVSPKACAEVLSATQPPIDDYDDVVAQSATVAATTTVEVLLEGSETRAAVSSLTDAVEACPEAQISSPELGEATLTFEALDAPAVGDAVAAVRYTTTLTQGGQEVSVPALVGLVQDGDRVITLLTIATDGSSPDEAAFTSLLEQAFEVQAEKLG